MRHFPTLWKRSEYKIVSKKKLTRVNLIDLFFCPFKKQFHVLWGSNLPNHRDVQNTFPRKADLLWLFHAYTVCPQILIPAHIVQLDQLSNCTDRLPADI